MCECQHRTVRLHSGGRYFTCAHCLRVREHPPFDLHYYIEGHAYCDLCGLWMKIEKYGEDKTGQQRVIRSAST